VRLGEPTFRADVVDSTMAWARAAVERGEALPGALFVAGAQRAGRGRHGRGWASPAGKGLYVTLVVDRRLAAPAVTLAAALATAEAAERACGLAARLKWPNDLLAAGRKWGGVLAELSAGPSGEAVLLGIGVNVGQETADLQGLEGRATSLRLETGVALTPEALLGELLPRLEERLHDFARGGFPQIAAAYLERAAFRPGDALLVEGPGGSTRTVTFRGLDSEGRLLVAEEARPIASGTVFRVRGVARPEGSHA
jgi:BirA family biotin operon repressor/biotin-[acetyl-CoA-carboxylase] ligase